MENRRYTFRQILDAYQQKKQWERQFPVNYYFVRPVSFLLTYTVLKITEKPERVAFFGFGCGCLGCILLSAGGNVSLWPGLFFVATYSLFDAVDGNIARVTRNVTLFGKYLDGILGDVIDGSYLFFVGIGAMAIGEGEASFWPLLFGSFSVLGRMWSKIFEQRYERYRFLHEGAPAVGKESVNATIKTSRWKNNWFYRLDANADTLNNQLILLVLCYFFGVTNFFLFLFCCYYCLRAPSLFPCFYDQDARCPLRLKLRKRTLPRSFRMSGIPFMHTICET